MDLTEIAPSRASPHKCYVKGPGIESEGPNVDTLGFKDGAAVVRKALPKIPRDIKTIKDKVTDRKSIDLSKLTKVTVRLDPVTGKKYILKDGKKLEILPKDPVTNLPILGSIVKAKRLEGPPPLAALTGAKQIILKKASVLSNGQTNGSVGGAKMDGVKYHVVSMNMKKTTSKVDVEWSEKTVQTESMTRDSTTQTDYKYLEERESPFTDQFLRFILSDCDMDTITRKMINPNKITTQEEKNKVNFYNDMRAALILNSSGNLPIHESVIQSDLRGVQRNCIILTAIKETVNIVNEYGYTSLHLAILYDIDAEIVKILLDNGADLNATDSEGNNAVHLAIQHSSSLLRLLISGTDTKKFDMNTFNHEGYTPLVLACLKHSYHDARLLLQHGADPNIRDMKSGRTALFHASEQHDEALVELLMNSGADTKIRNFFGTSSHDAMFEFDYVSPKIMFSVLGRDPQKAQPKKRPEPVSPLPLIQPPAPKQPKLKTTPILRRVSSIELIKSAKKS